VREDWEEHLPRKPSSCTAFLKGTLAENADEQSICCHRQLNSLAILGDSEELYLPGSSHRHAPHQEGTRSSSAGSWRLPRGRPRRMGKPRQLPDGDSALPAHSLPLIVQAKRSEDQAWEKPGRTVSPACYPLTLASVLLAPDAGGTTISIRWMHMSWKQLHYTKSGSPTTQVLDEFKNGVPGASIYSRPGTPLSRKLASPRGARLRLKRMENPHRGNKEELLCARPTRRIG
jgi:hypothetical protein